MIDKPTVATSLVLDRSGSMDATSGVGTLKRIDLLRNSAPLQLAGPKIGGTGRSDPFTAIGDGIETAAIQLAVAAGFTTSATIVFTDGHETEPKYISDVADLVTSRVFAVGLGTAKQLNPIALDDLVNHTGGYLLLTGNAGSDDLLLVQKYLPDHRRSQQQPNHRRP